MTQSEIIPLAK